MNIERTMTILQSSLTEATVNQQRLDIAVKSFELANMENDQRKADNFRAEIHSLIDIMLDIKATVQSVIRDGK